MLLYNHKETNEEEMEMTKYRVESRRNYTEIFDNYIGDCIVAETAEEAIELYKQWLVENGCDTEEVEEYEYQVSEW